MTEDTNQMPPRIEAWTEPFDRSMTFTCVAGTDEHWAATCDWVPSLPGSAEYVRADIAERLLAAPAAAPAAAQPTPDAGYAGAVKCAAFATRAEYEAWRAAHASRDAEVAELRAENERLKSRSDAFVGVELLFRNAPVSELGVEVIKLIERFHAANCVTSVPQTKAPQ